MKTIIRTSEQDCSKLEGRRRQLCSKWVKNGLMDRIAGAVLLLVLASSACGSRARWTNVLGNDYSSIGERIYYTGIGGDGLPIAYSGGPRSGGMMGGGRLSCASCHGEDGQGGTYFMHMEVVQAPNITVGELNGEQHEPASGGEDHHDADEAYELDDFRQAVVFGRHPNGDSLDTLMPRWKMELGDLSDLFDYIKTFP